MPSRTGTRQLLLASLAVTTLTFTALANAQPCSPADGIELVATDRAAPDNFSKAVSLSGDIAIFGAHQDDVVGSNSGSAYIFRFDGTDWAQEARLIPTDAAAHARFGNSVSVSGNAVVVGANRVDGSTGSAYVFRFNGIGWEQEAKLTADDREPGDFFGDSVSISGNTIVVGAPGDDDNGSSSGSAYIFRLNGSDWIQDAKLLAANFSNGADFGDAVSISGDTALVGAWRDHTNGIQTGAAYVFRFNGIDWILESKLLSPDGNAGSWFGFAVSISNDTVLVGSPTRNSAFVFRQSDSDWKHESTLRPPDGSGGQFGISACLSSDTAIVGAYRDDELGDNVGSAYIFTYSDNSSWVREAKLFPTDDRIPHDSFGWSVSISGDTAAIGAYSDDQGAGTGYVFDLNCMTVCLPDVNDDGSLSPTDFNAWINAFNIQLPECDQNGDGSCTPTDFTAWIANFNAGC